MHELEQTKIQTVLITGGSSGIGLSLVKNYLALGFRVVTTGTNKDKLAKLKHDLITYYDNNLLIFNSLDVRNKEEMEDWLKAIDNDYPFDIIIANAGVSLDIGDIKTNIDNIDEIAKKTYEVNVFGVFNTIHPLLNKMIDRNSGSIVIISSIASLFGVTKSIFYSSSKVAIRFYGERLRQLLKPYNINVVIVNPGFVVSDMSKRHTSRLVKNVIIPTTTAAEYIIEGIKNRKSYIRFPLYFYFIVYIISIMPFFIKEKILQIIKY